MVDKEEAKRKLINGEKLTEEEYYKLELPFLYMEVIIELLKEISNDLKNLMLRI